MPGSGVWHDHMISSEGPAFHVVGTRDYSVMVDEWCMIDWHQKIRERVLCEIFNITLIYQLSRLLENFVFISLSFWALSTQTNTCLVVLLVYMNVSERILCHENPRLEGNHSRKTIYLLFCFLFLVSLLFNFAVWKNYNQLVGIHLHKHLECIWYEMLFNYCILNSLSEDLGDIITKFPEDGLDN